MTTPDIVARLRDWRTLHLARLGGLFDEAAAEIERLRLTDAEREAVQLAIGWIESPVAEDEAMPEDYLPITATLRGLLERTK